MKDAHRLASPNCALSPDSCPAGCVLWTLNEHNRRDLLPSVAVPDSGSIYRTQFTLTSRGTRTRRLTLFCFEKVLFSTDRKQEEPRGGTDGREAGWTRNGDCLQLAESSLCSCILIFLALAQCSGTVFCFLFFFFLLLLYKTFRRLEPNASF